MNTIATLGKYLDQPHLVRKLYDTMPALLTTGAVAYGAYDTLKAPKDERKEKFIKNALVLAGTVTSALIAVRGLTLGKIKIPGLIEKPEFTAKEAITNFIKSNSGKLKNSVRDILEESKEKILSTKKIAFLHEELKGIKGGKKLFDEIIPPPKDHGAGEIAGEIGRLSLLGAIPVIGGIAGGIAGSYATGERGDEFAKNTENKMKEGTYQYLANIVLCNIGAAGALGIMEIPKVKNFLKAKNINSQASRLGAMVAGITAVGIVGGSAIANFIGKKINLPSVAEQRQPSAPASASLADNTSLADNKGLTGLYSERHPEFLDVALHVDDFATVGVLSGFSWIEPALPVMYSISGYRAGMGYRNGHGKAHRHRNKAQHQNCPANAKNSFLKSRLDLTRKVNQQVY